MTTENVIIGKCRDFQLSNSTFKKLNRPATIIAILAIIIPIGVLYPTSITDDKGDVDITTSPYAIFGGIGFLAGVGIALFYQDELADIKYEQIKNGQFWH